MRCAAIDGRRFLNSEKLDTKKIANAADILMKFRSYSENEEMATGRFLNKHEKCATVLILLDNSNDSIAKYLASTLEELTLKGGIAFDTPLFVLLYVCSSADFDAISNSDQEVGGGTVTCDDCQILQKLDPDEIDIFRARRDFLVDQDRNLEDMMSFVIMSENFDDQSEYVKKVVLVS